MQAAKFNEFQASYGMGADTSKAREPAEKVQKEKDQQKTTQQVPHVDMSVSPWDKALDKEPCDLIFETPVGSAQQLSSPGLITPDRTSG